MPAKVKESMQDIIAKHPFFKKFDPYFYPFLAGCGSNQYFPEGEYLFQEGGKAEHFYLVRSGEVDLEMFIPNHGKMIVQTIKEGQAIGWSWLFPPYKWHLAAKAVMPTRVTMLDAKCLRDKCESNHDLGYEFFKRIAHVVAIRLQATQHHLMELNKLLPPLRPWWKEDIP